MSRFLKIMREKEYDEALLLAGTGINPERLHDPSYFISSEDHQTFRANLIRASGDCGIGLELGQSLEAAHLGILAYTGQSCTTIREGVVNIWSRYAATFGVETTLLVRPRDTRYDVITIQSPRVTEPIYRFQIEEALCVLLKMGAVFTGYAPRIVRIELAYPKPAYYGAYEAIFDCAPVFAAESSAITLERDWLDTPLKTTDLELNRVGREYLERVLAQSHRGESLTAQLRQLLLDCPGDIPALSVAAKSFGVSPRTLTRHLAQEGCSYREMVTSMRCELAQSWLGTQQMSVKEVSFHLGFRDVTAFRRAFKAWTGQSIGAWRTGSHARQPEHRPQIHGGQAA